MEDIRWGIIGCGDVTEVKSGPGFSRAEGSQLVAVMRRSASLAEDYARRHGVERWSDRADDIVEADDIDAVYVATHPDTHGEYVLRCAAAGKPVYVEKPMARTYEECREMIEACRRAVVPLWVGYYRRALPRFLTIKRLIEEGAIGQVRAVQTVQFQPLPEGGPGATPWQLRSGGAAGGLFFDAACHNLDFLDFLFGPIVTVEGEAANRAGAYAPEDTVCAAFRFASGVLGSGFWCYATDVREDVTTVFGATGRLCFSVQSRVPIRLRRGEEVEEIDVADPEHVHQPMIQSIVDELHGHGWCDSTGESGARTAWVMDVLLDRFRQSRDELATER